MGKDKTCVTITAWEAVYAIQEGRKTVKPTFQGTVYNLLERPRGWKSYAYHFGVLSAVVACLLFSIIISAIEDKDGYSEALFGMEITLAVFLTSEYLARIWSAGCRSKYLGLWGRVRFITKPVSIIDLVVILATIFVIIFGSNGRIFAASAVRGIRFLQILRMLHMDRQGGSWRLLGSVIYMHRQELLTSLYIGFLGLLFSSYFMYLVEKDIMFPEPSNFGTYADAVWWGVVTMMTIGYGDKVPQTWAGRALACASAMFTVSFFMLPAGILSSGFALKVQQQQRQKHFSRQIPAAATLIQCLWRCYAADKRFNSIATWDIYFKRRNHDTSNKFKALGGLRLRKPKKCPAELGKGTYTSTNYVKNKLSNGRNSYEDIVVDLNVPKSQKGALHHSRSVPDLMIVVNQDPFYSSSKDQEKRESVFRSPGESICDTTSEDNDIFIQDTSPVTVLTEAHKNAIRAIRKIKYFVAKRRFQQARKPYDVGDVIEQYSQGQLSMMVRIKELQRRLDHMLGKPNANGEKSGKHLTLGNKLNHMDHQVQRLEKKLDNINFLLHNILDNISNQQKAVEDAPKAQ